MRPAGEQPAGRICDSARAISTFASSASAAAAASAARTPSPAGVVASPVVATASPVGGARVPRPPALPAASCRCGAPRAPRPTSAAGVPRRQCECRYRAEDQQNDQGLHRATPVLRAFRCATVMPSPPAAESKVEEVQRFPGTRRPLVCIGSRTRGQGWTTGPSSTPVRFRDLSSGFAGGSSSVVAASGCCLVAPTPVGPVQQSGHGHGWWVEDGDE